MKFDMFVIFLQIIQGNQEYGVEPQSWHWAP